MTWLAERWLLWRGWRFIGVVPDLPKMLIVGGPHTSNWDFVVFLAAIRHWHISPSYIGKHTLFRRPFGWFFKRLGGIPVDRRRPGGLVAQVAEAFDASDRMILVISPEGTRKAVPYWKSGFVKIAERTGAPIVPAYISYENKEVALGPPISFDGDEKKLMDEMRPFLLRGGGRNPEGEGPVRLKSEPKSS
ncbi:MAG: 1-acyl-sn-glycerol-3-phosphate acyltransferase [Acidimicrobiia bacterium]